MSTPATVEVNARLSHPAKQVTPETGVVHGPSPSRR
jgi:hypothetical protein